ncbi:hypothetical protein PMAC_003233 [Pneumocystis sp. 'macacae']|nr:hypothetical protein PMAC_003233 [Pneumocystis sp. 'macacae']
MYLFLSWLFLVLFLFFACLLIARRFLIPYISIPWFTKDKAYLPVNSFFQADMEAGFSSKTFDIYQNIQNGDKRAGLDDHAKEQIHHIMEEHGCGFDEARMIYNQKCMKRNSIDPKTGRPIDPKAVFFS